MDRARWLCPVVISEPVRASPDCWYYCVSSLQSVPSTHFTQVPMSAPSLLVLETLNFRKPLTKPKPAYMLLHQSSRDLWRSSAHCLSDWPHRTWWPQASSEPLALPAAPLDHPVASCSFGKKISHLLPLLEASDSPSLSRLSVEDLLSLTKISGDLNESLDRSLSYRTHSGVCTYIDGSLFTPLERERFSCGDDPTLTPGLYRWGQQHSFSQV